MSSTSIYSHTCIDRTPYTYLIGWSHLGVFYYGKRTQKGCHPDDFWVKYFTSSKRVAELRLYCEPDIIEIRHISDSVEKINNLETNVLKHLNAAKSDKWLNGTNGDCKWYCDSFIGHKGAATRKSNGTDKEIGHKSHMTRIKNGTVSRTRKVPLDFVPWNKGLTKATDSRVIGTKLTEEHKAKLNRKGLKHTEETKAKLRRPKSDEHRRKLADAAKKTPFDWVVIKDGIEIYRDSNLQYICKTHNLPERDLINSIDKKPIAENTEYPHAIGMQLFRVPK